MQLQFWPLLLCARHRFEQDIEPLLPVEPPDKEQMNRLGFGREKITRCAPERIGNRILDHGMAPVIAIPQRGFEIVVRDVDDPIGKAA